MPLSYDGTRAKQNIYKIWRLRGSSYGIQL